MKTDMNVIGLAHEVFPVHNMGQKVLWEHEGGNGWFWLGPRIRTWPRNILVGGEEQEGHSKWRKQHEQARTMVTGQILGNKRQRKMPRTLKFSNQFCHSHIFHSRSLWEQDKTRSFWPQNLMWKLALVCRNQRPSCCSEAGLIPSAHTSPAAPSPFYPGPHLNIRLMHHTASKAQKSQLKEKPSRKERKWVFPQDYRAKLASFST